MVVLFLVSLIYATTYPYYEVTSSETYEFQWTLQLELQYSNPSEFGLNFESLQVEAFKNTDTQFRITISPSNTIRWEPEQINNTKSGEEVDYSFEFTTSPFSFSLTRKLDNEVLFYTGFESIYYADKYLEFSTEIPSPNFMYGLGERVTSFQLDTNNTYYTIWNLAQDCPYDTGKGERGRNMYGHHPFYLEMRKGKAHGVYFHNSNAMDAVFTENRLTFKSIGGIIDIFIFTGPSVEKVLEDYHEVIGKPNLPPFWALGFHECRWGYVFLSDLINVVTGYDLHGIPLDVLWTDIDYMDAFKDFTLDYSRYPLANFKALLDYLHSTDRHYVPIVDAGISATDYFAYNQRTEQNVFVKRRNDSDEPFYGQVWPGKSVFVDFFNPNSSEYWKNMLNTLYESVEFDGLWLDMNEASSFCDGECPEYYSTPEIKTSIPYIPGNHSLEDQVLPLDAWHYGDILSYNSHALYATMETKASYEFLAEKLQKRPFVLSRSSRPGHGVWGNHWLGDNFSNWDELRYTVQGVLNFQMFGIPLVGADVCGFHNNTSPELCARWLEVGIFYPFFRNHNDIGANPEELYALGEELEEIAIKTIRLRYSLSMYLYSEIFSTSLEGGAVVRPMFYEYPEIESLYGNEEEFMWGPYLLVVPVLEEGAREVKGYLPPEDTWYNFYTGKKVLSGEEIFDAPLDTVNLFVKEGACLPFEESESVNRILKMRQKPVELIFVYSDSGLHSDTFYFDDGISLNTIEEKNYGKLLMGSELMQEGSFIVFYVNSNSFESTDYRHVTLIKIYGLPYKVISVKAQNGKTFLYERVDWFSQTEDLLIIGCYFDLVDSAYITIN